MEDRAGPPTEDEVQDEVQHGVQDGVQDEPAHGPAPEAQPGRYQRSFAGLVGAMLLLLLVVVGFVLLRDANRTQPDNREVAVDWRSSASYAQREAEFDLLAPRRLPEGWRATSVRFGAGDTRTWHLGLLTDEGRYVGLEQATDSPGTLVEKYVDEDAEPGEDVVIAGETWESWSAGDDTALVREGRDVTTLVVGTTSRDELEDFIRSLS